MVTRHFRRLGALVGLLAGLLMAPGLSATALETTERLLSYNWGKLLIKPQFDLTSQFTDNVFYGNDDVLRTNYPTVVVVLSNGVPVGTITVPRDTPSSGTIATNVFRSHPEESELLFVVSPGMKLQYGETGGNTIALDYAYDRIFYVNFPDFNTAQHRGAVTTRLQLSRFTIAGEDRVDYLSSFLSGGNAFVRQQVDRLVWVDNYRVTYDASEKTDFYVVGYHNSYDYLSTVNLYDQETLRGTLGATYKWTERIRVFVEGEYGQSSINPNLPTTLQPKGPHSVIFGGFVGARGEFTARLSGSLKVGYEARTFPGDFAPGAEPSSTSSPAVGAELNYAAGPKTFFKLTYDRRTDVSPQFAQQSYIYDTVRLSANQFIGTTGKWLATATAGFDFGDFSETPGRNQARSDRILSAGLRLTYQPRPWFATVLAYDYDNYTTDFKDPVVAATTQLIDYQVNTIRLTFVIGY